MKPLKVVPLIAALSAPFFGSGCGQRVSKEEFFIENPIPPPVEPAPSRLPNPLPNLPKAKESKDNYVLEFKRENRVTELDIQNALSPFNVHHLGGDVFQLVPKDGVHMIRALEEIKKLEELGMTVLNINPKDKGNFQNVQNQFIPRHGFAIDFEDGLTEDEIKESLQEQKVTDMKILVPDVNAGVIVIESSKPVNEILWELNKNPKVENASCGISFYKDYIIRQGNFIKRSELQEGDEYWGDPLGPTEEEKAERMIKARMKMEEENPGNLLYMFSIVLEENLSEDKVKEKFHSLNAIEAVKLSDEEDKNRYMITVDSKSSSVDVERQLKETQGVKEVKFNNYIYKAPQGEEKEN